MKIQYLICLLLFSLNACSQQSGNSYVNIDNKAFAEKMKDEQVIVLDVRTPDEFSQGHIPGAQLMDYLSPDFSTRIASLDKNKTYLVYCAAGSRSAKASDIMTRNGFKNIYNLKGGYNAWNGEKEK